MSRVRRSTYNSPLNETEAQRTARLDREAIRAYAAQRFGGGGMSKRYHQDMADITASRTEAEPAKKP